MSYVKIFIIAQKELQPIETIYRAHHLCELEWGVTGKGWFRADLSEK